MSERQFKKTIAKSTNGGFWRIIGGFQLLNGGFDLFNGSAKWQKTGVIRAFFFRSATRKCGKGTQLWDIFYKRRFISFFAHDTNEYILCNFMYYKIRTFALLKISRIYEFEIFTENQ